MLVSLKRMTDEEFFSTVRKVLSLWSFIQGTYEYREDKRSPYLNASIDVSTEGSSISFTHMRDTGRICVVVVFGNNSIDRTYDTYEDLLAKCPKLLGRIQHHLILGSDPDLDLEIEDL